MYEQGSLQQLPISKNVINTKIFTTNPACYSVTLNFSLLQDKNAKSELEQIHYQGALDLTLNIIS